MRELNWSEFKQFINSRSLETHYVEFESRYEVYAFDGVLHFYCDLQKDSALDFETNYKPASNKKIGSYYTREPFAAKVLKNGKKLYRRKHGYLLDTIANSSTTLTIPVPYNECKINKIEIIDANSLDQIDLQVLDTPTGTLSTIPNYMLNQFGFDVVVSDFLYSDKSDYDADLVKDMQLKITYKNNTTSNKKVGFNVIFHEVI